MRNIAQRIVISAIIIVTMALPLTAVAQNQSADIAKAEQALERLQVPEMAIAHISGYQLAGHETPEFMGALSSYYCAMAVNLAGFNLAGGANSAYSAQDYRTLADLFILRMHAQTPFEAGEIEQMPLIMRQTAEAQLNIDLRQTDNETIYLAKTLPKCDLLYREALLKRPTP